MELRLGIMSNYEIDEWMNHSKGYMMNHKARVLKDLAQYADFEVLRGRVDIKNIKEEEYTRNRSKIYKVIKTELPRLIIPGKPWTCAQMGNYFYCKYGAQLGGKDITYERNVRKVRDEVFPSWRYVQAKLYKGEQAKDNKYVLLTEKEEGRQTEILNEFITERQQKIIIEMIIQGENFEKVQEYFKMKYLDYKNEMKNELKCDRIVNAILI